MKLSKIALYAAAIAAFSLPFSAQAAKGEKRNKTARPAFTEVDKDKDGAITKDEYVAAMKDSIGQSTAETQFASLDKNNDGKLTKEEFDAGASGKKGRKKKNS